MRFIEADNLMPKRTSISNLFLQTFLPKAPSDFLKVYLFTYFLAKEKIAFDMDELNNELGLGEDKIRAAFDYWGEEGLIEIKDGDIYFHDPDSLTLSNIMDTNTEDIDYEQRLIESNQNPEIRDMFSQADYIVRRQLVPEEKKRIISWMMDYNMSPDMILHAISYSYDIRGSKSLDYVAAMIRRWYDKGYTNLDQVLDEGDSLSQSHIEIVKSSLNLNQRQITPAVREMIDSWRNKLGFTDEMISLACAQTVNISDPNVNYVNAVLNNWYEEGIKSPEDAKEQIKKKPKKNYYNKTKTDDYLLTTERQTDGITESELEDLLGWKGEL